MNSDLTQSSSSDSRGFIPAGWTLRVAMAGCFLGHGACGVVTKAAWLPYFGVVHIGPDLAWKLMPCVGWCDIAIAVLALVWPCRALLAWALFWTVWTALLRPFSGESWWEFFERAGNYGVPLAWLSIVGWRGPWLAYLPVRQVSPSARASRRLRWILRAATISLLIGHAGFGLVLRKAGLAHQYSAVWPQAPISLLTGAGAIDLVLAAFVLARPSVALLVIVCGWKIATETLYPVSGALVAETVERAGSYGAPLALAFLMVSRAYARNAGPGPTVKI